MATADAIYFGGRILTMAGDEPRYADAVAIAAGEISYVGDRSGAFAQRVPTTRMVDLAGHALLPGFISTHGHIWSGEAPALEQSATERIAEARLAENIGRGFTTVQEAGSDAVLTNTWRKLGAEARLAVDVVAYPRMPAETGYLVKHGTTRSYAGRFRIGGVTLHVGGDTEASVVDAMVSFAFEHRWQVLCECDCDGANDVFLRAVSRAAGLRGNQDRRTVLIHRHPATVEEIVRMRELGIIGHHEAPPENGFVALKALTEWGAYRYFEEHRKGTVTPGLLADFVVLERDPLEVAPEEIKDLRVLETIKEGTTVFMAGGPPSGGYRKGSGLARRAHHH